MATNYPKLKAEMALNGENLTDLAELLGVTVGAVSNRFTGRADWTKSDIDKVCAHYNKSYESLFV